MLAQVLVEAPAGPLARLFELYRRARPDAADVDGWVSECAQTIAYGLFVARLERDRAGEGTTLAAAQRLVRAAGGKIAGEVEAALGGVLGAVVAAIAMRLEAVEIEGVSADEDPGTGFFEPFLAAHDPGLRRRLGVFYTPRAVVEAIVGGVDALLRAELGLSDGLASTTTWGELAARGVAMPEGVGAGEDFVAILDFATGTGAFLCACLRVIEATMKGRWRGALGTGAEAEVLRRWRAYVPVHVLPRLCGVEPMLGAFVVARVQMVGALARTGYVVTGEDRLGVALGDALASPPERRFTVIVGNPPYASSRSSPAWLCAALGRWKEGLHEVKSDLLREEWKFLRLAEWLAEQVPRAVVGVVVNRDLLVGIAKRRARASLQATFPLRRIVDLHGDVRGDFVDDNVFAITQGVAIAWLCRGGRAGHEVCSLRGRRAEKLARLAELPEPTRGGAPEAPYYRWDMSEETCESADEYAGWLPLPQIFAVHGSGIQTKNDALCVGFAAAEVLARVGLLARASEAEAREELAIRAGGAWSLAAAQEELRALGPGPERVRRILYRPFDWRWTYMSEKSGGFLGRPRAALMRHMTGEANLGLVFNRQIVGPRVSHFGVTRDPICHGTFYLGNRGQDFLAPLFLREEGPGTRRRHNFRAEFVAAMAAGAGVMLGAEALFGYVVAIVHSPMWRTRYREAIQRDFARIPIAASEGLARRLAAIGGELVGLHLLETVTASPELAVWTGPAGAVVEVVRWSENTVWIDKCRAVGFAGVPEAVWRFELGGYAVCAKWLKDRRGRSLGAEEVAHYRRMVAAVAATMAVTGRIDEAIAAHGGWPGAFVTERRA